MNIYTVTLYPYHAPTLRKWCIAVFAKDRDDACERAYRQLALTADGDRPMWADCSGWRTEMGTTTHRRMR